MNSKRSLTEETRAGDVGNPEYNLAGPCLLLAMVTKYLWVVERKTGFGSRPRRQKGEFLWRDEIR